jgi:nicotinamide mononucleotide transporter
MSLAEVAGFIFGIAGIFLTMKENPWCFPVGLANVIISLFIFFGQKLYADALQQVVYIILLTYGWWNWLHGPVKSSLPVTVSDARLLIRLLLIWIAGSVSLGWVLHRYTDASTPWPDSIATVLSFIAQWMIARKKLENWILWMIVNVMYISIYLYKDLYLYAVLFSIYLLLAIKGHLIWRQALISNEKN